MASMGWPSISQNSALLMKSASRSARACFECFMLGKRLPKRERFGNGQCTYLVRLMLKCISLQARDHFGSIRGGKTPNQKEIYDEIWFEYSPEWPVGLPIPRCSCASPRSGNHPFPESDGMQNPCQRRRV